LIFVLPYQRISLAETISTPVNRGDDSPRLARLFHEMPETYKAAISLHEKGETPRQLVRIG